MLPSAPGFRDSTVSVVRDLQGRRKLPHTYENVQRGMFTSDALKHGFCLDDRMSARSDQLSRHCGRNGNRKEFGEVSSATDLLEEVPAHFLVTEPKSVYVVGNLES